MKTILKLILALLPIFSVGTVNTVKAAENDSQFTRQVIEGAYYYQEDLDTGEIMTGRANIFYMNNQIAYCIEPLVQITDDTYSSTSDWSVIDLTEDQIDFIEKVGYFGYEYEGHQTERYYMATQELIWESVKNVDAKYTTERGGGEEIDLTAEKEEILSLVESYDLLPSFANSTIESVVGDEITLSDENGVLEQYDIEYDGVNVVTINDDQLIIDLNDDFVGEETIKFVKNNYDNQVNLIYYQESSQTLATLRISNPMTFELTLKVSEKVEETEEEEIIIEQVVVPDTLKQQSNILTIITVILCASGIGIIIYGEIKNKNTNSKEK